MLICFYIISFNPLITPGGNWRNYACTQERLFLTTKLWQSKDSTWESFREAQTCRRTDTVGFAAVRLLMSIKQYASRSGKVET